MVAELGARGQAPASARSFAQTLQAQGSSQEALAAGTGSFPPSPAPSSAATTPTSVSSAGTSAAVASALANVLPQLDTTSFGDDSSSPDASGAATPLASLPTSAQLLAGSQVATAAASGASAAAITTGPGAGLRALAAAETAIGVTESPSGSNDGPGLAIFRSAVQGAEAGQPWCAYFASWAAKQGGQALGDQGQGIGSVEGIAEWAQSTGRLKAAGTTPSPGDLVLFGGRHVGIVEAVNPDGTLTTVEGNYRNSVQRVRRSPLEATGYVSLG